MAPLRDTTRDKNVLKDHTETVNIVINI